MQNVLQHCLILCKRNVDISRFMYKQLLVKMIDVDCPYDIVKLWASEIDETQDLRVERSIALSWKKVIPIMKLRYFQYKIIHMKLTTNIQISSWNKDVASLYSSCGYHEESVLHLYTECEVIPHLFSALNAWLMLHTGYCLDLLPTNIIFNTCERIHD